MKLVHVVQRFAPAVGGAETHVREVVEELARRGHDVTVATSAHPGAQDDARTPAGGGASYRVRRFAARTYRGDYLFPPWLPMRGLREFLVAERPDVLHAHSYRFATVEAAAEASLATGTPLVITAHGFYPPENLLVAAARWRYDAGRGRRSLARAARVIAVTAHETAHYESLGVARDRIDVIPNGIPLTAFEPGNGRAFREKNTLGDGPLVLFLARLAHDKGLADLVRAWPLVTRRVPTAKLAVCGRDAGARGNAEALARKDGVAASVRFLGAVDEPRNAYAACDVFVLPSHYEAFGIVLLEAMAQARPVIATRAGGMPEVVGEAGRIVAPRDPRALADALIALLTDAAEARRLGTAGVLRARGFLWDSVVDRLQETYARALGGKPA